MGAGGAIFTAGAILATLYLYQKRKQSDASAYVVISSNGGGNDDGNRRLNDAVQMSISGLRDMFAKLTGGRVSTPTDTRAPVIVSPPDNRTKTPAVVPAFDPSSSGSSAGMVEQFVDQIIKVESGGSANARNPFSSATGAGQFIESTWLSMIYKHRPDLTTGRSRSQILDLRLDYDISREMTQRLGEDNSAVLRQNGITPTPGRIYLAHFLGAAGAIKALRADDAASVGEVMGSRVVNSNPFLKGRDIAYLKSWADRKMGA